MLIVELLNSAIEATVDHISLEHHPLAKKAKDMSSAAVLLCMINATLIWCFALL
ncbi:MAG TPA: diacylglycerol kinase [Candidatus Berkiella sp.]|nr:diacylglycerol kinase [Candidatus Berkiella sp.]